MLLLSNINSYSNRTTAAAETSTEPERHQQQHRSDCTTAVVETINTVDVLSVSITISAGSNVLIVTASNAVGVV